MNLALLGFYEINMEANFKNSRLYFGCFTYKISFLVRTDFTVAYLKLPPESKHVWLCLHEVYEISVQLRKQSILLGKQCFVFLSGHLYVSLF